MERIMARRLIGMRMVRYSQRQISKTRETNPEELAELLHQ